MKKSARAGYTLLEMSIVLIIIGVLVAAVLFGQSLIATSRLQTVITDMDSYTSAVGSFKQQYNALPGDFANATSVWGQVSSGCTTQAGTGTQTCNGNGDGQVGSVSGQEYEMFRFWQQLQNAGLFSQNMSGVSYTTGVNDTMPGYDAPKGSIKGSGFSAVWVGTIAASNATYFPGFYGNTFIFGGANAGSWTSAPILTPDQASAIDTKIDDGFPGTGKVRSPWANCTTTSSAPASAASTAYNLSGTTSASIVCDLIFVPGF